MHMGIALSWHNPLPHKAFSKYQQPDDFESFYEA